MLYTVLAAATMNSKCEVNLIQAYERGSQVSILPRMYKMLKSALKNKLLNMFYAGCLAIHIWG